MRASHLFFVATSLSIVACNSDSVSGPELSIAIAPLTLSGVTDVCYNIWVTNAPNGGGDVVWRKDMVCASQYGSASGDIAYVGTCDADGPGGARAGSVSIAIVDIWGGGNHASNATGFVPHADYQNPCGTSDYVPAYGSGTGAWNSDGFPVCQQNVTCRENEDTSVAFDITLLRAANQGFFDVAVSFADVFCSAKFDCKYEEGASLVPMNLLFANDNQRHDSAVLALACTAGTGTPVPDTNMYMDDIVVVCDGQEVARLDPSVNDAGDPGPGNQLNPAGGYDDADANPIFQWQVSQGKEALGQGSFEKAYWNVAIGFDVSDLAGRTCRLQTRATASENPLTNGMTPAGATYPIIIWDVELNANDAGALTCGRHPVSGDPVAPVRTSYVGTENCFANHLATNTNDVTSTANVCPDIACTSDAQCGDGNACTADTCDQVTGDCTNLGCFAPQIAWNNLDGLSNSSNTTATEGAPLVFTIDGWAQPIKFYRTGGQVRRYLPSSTFDGSFPSEHPSFTGYSFGWTDTFPYIDILSNGGARVSGTITFEFGAPSTNRGPGWRYVVAMAGMAGTNGEGPMTITADAPLAYMGKFDAFGTGRYGTFTAPSTIVGHNGGGADGYSFFLLGSDRTSVSFNLSEPNDGGTPDQFGFVVGMVNVGTCPSGCEQK